MFAIKAVTNETTAASRITDFSNPNLFTIPIKITYFIDIINYNLD
jgi:hypothetical protein